MGPERDQSYVIQLLLENWVGCVRVDVNLLCQLSPLLLIAENVPGGLERTLANRPGLFGRGSILRLGRSLLYSLGAQTNTPEESPNSAGQTFYRVDGVHDHLPGRRDGSRRVGRDRLHKHFRLAGVLQFDHRRYLRYANPEHLSP